MSSQPARAGEPTRAKDLKISEIFASLQGEGPSSGVPCLFVRLAQCNLHCVWCDTRYTWDWQQFRYDDEVHVEPVARVAERVAAAPEKRLVLTGGEPLLQQAALAELLGAIPTDVFVEVETNGTQRPLPALAERVDQWNVSPKLSSCGDPERLRIKPDALLALRDTDRAFLKLVVNGDGDLAEADELVARFSWPRSRVLFMPEARSKEELDRRSPAVARAAAARGLRFSSRLHLTLFDGRRGT